MPRSTLSYLLWLILGLAVATTAFIPSVPSSVGDRYANKNLLSKSNIVGRSKSSNDQDPSLEYRNVVTNVLSNFMMKQEKKKSDDKDEELLLPDIDFNVSKIRKVPLPILAQALDAELCEKEWFVTGRVNPSYFADSFEFRDPDVNLQGIEKYAIGVRRLFDQNTARAEIISTVVNTTIPNTITCTWRLSGKVNIGPGLVIKPYIVYTDFTVDETTGLIVFQQDRFDLPQWDILLSALFPFLIGKITAPPAPPVEPRSVSMPKSLGGTSTSPLDAWKQFFAGALK